MIGRFHINATLVKQVGVFDWPFFNDCAGVNQIHSKSNARSTSVKDFGAAGDGGVDDSGAVQAAVDAVADGGVIWFPAGIYRIDREIRVRNRSGISFLATGARVSGGPGRIRSFFHCDGSRDLTFDGLTFDQRGSYLPRYRASEHGNTYHCPIQFINGEGLTVKNAEFNDLYCLSLFFFQSSRLVVEKCVFRCGVSLNDQWLQFIHLQTYGGANAIAGCRFNGAVATTPEYNPAAVFASGGGLGSSLTIEDNHAEYCGRNNHGSHRLGVFDIYGDAQNVIVRNNVSLHTMAQFMRLSSTRNAQISGNRVVMSANAELDYSIFTVESVITFAPGQVGCQNIEISANRFEDLSGRAAFAVGILSYDWGAPATAIKVKGNIFVGCRRAVAVYGPFLDVQIVHNGGQSGRNSIEVGHNGTDGAQVTATRASEARGRFDGLLIALNVLRNDSPNDSNAITINLSKAPRYSGTVGSFVIRENSLRRIGKADAGQAIAVIVNASRPQGDVLISSNETEGYTHHWYVRGTKDVVIDGNRALNALGAPYLDDGTNGSVTRRNNRVLRK